MTRTCRICGREAPDLVRNDALDLWWCPEPWECLIRAGGADRQPVQGARGEPPRSRADEGIPL